MKIALGQMEVRPGRPSENLETMLAMVDQAKGAGAELIVFPEMALPGYLLGDGWEQRAFLEDCQACGDRLVQASQGVAILFGNVAVDWERHNDDGRPRKYNALFAAQEGRLVQPLGAPYPFAIKTLLPSYREFDDPRHFYSARKLAEELRCRPEDLLQPLELTLAERRLRVGGLICEDGWAENYPFSPGEILAEKGVDLLVNVSCSPYTLGKTAKRHRLFGNQAAKAGVPLVYVNTVGVQNNGKTIYTFDGASSVYGPDGSLSFCAEAYQSQMAVVSLFEAPPRPALEPVIEEEPAAIYRALSYGIGKFMDSIGASRAVIGLSGGIDSAVSAALYAKVLGPDGVMLVNMPSRFNSSTTRGLAQQLAQNLGCRYTVMPIQQSVDATVEQLQSASVIQPGREPETLRVSSFVTENIQARDRSARVLAAIAASWGAVFTCNANKSEATVGYCTLYGDQSGFLAALADLWKHQVYDLARYLNQQVYRREVIPQGIIDIVPSAELSAEQDVDQGKGDPIQYRYHDYLFRAFVESWNRVTPQEVLEWYCQGILEEKLGCQQGLVAQLFPDARAFIQDLERWWNLYTGMAVAKRIQAPPVLALSRRAFGFDHREAQNGPYYTLKYRSLKDQLLRSQ